MQVDDEDFECLLDVCSNNGIGIDELKNATFFEFSILDEYDYTYSVTPLNKEVVTS
ncbi:hypothetical protein EOM39_05225 [Candidatus Gracilibacteria bacterium]|nr:hypothetical protein [Candidatus Gracilibacteria bacterium]